MWSFRVLLGACLLVACGQRSDEVLQCAKTTNVVFDPFTHEVCLDACVDDMDCPRGSLCARIDETTNGSCAIGSEEVQTSRSVLLSGFGVPEMPGRLVTTDAHEFAWERPAGATIVHCALFACPPAFRVAADKEGEWLTEVDPGAAEIANYDRCVLAEETSTQPDGTFNLRERDNEFHAPTTLSATMKPDGPFCDTAGHGCAPIDALLVGCWAYDETRIVAATWLASVDIVHGIYNFRSLFDSESGDCTSGKHRVCRRPQTLSPGPEKSSSIYGVCVEGACVAGCTRLSDCKDIDGGNDPRVNKGIGYCANATCVSLQTGE
jgi:hypothetical protein